MRHLENCAKLVSLGDNCKRASIRRHLQLAVYPHKFLCHAVDDVLTQCIEQTA